jgi:hypothetical protein
VVIQRPRLSASFDITDHVSESAKSLSQHRAFEYPLREDTGGRARHQGITRIDVASLQSIFSESRVWINQGSAAS